MISVTSIYRAKAYAIASLLLAAAVNAAALDIGGYTIRQTNTVKTYTFSAGTTVSSGWYVVVGRSATKTDFQTYWGVTLASNVVYLNAANNFPKIDGLERFSLLNAGNTNVDGMTPSSIDPLYRSIQRLSATNNAGSTSSWNSVTWSAATPGSGCSGNGTAGLRISEFSDAGSFQYEFVELYYDAAGTASNIPPVLQAIPNKTITISNHLQFAVVATPTDTNLVTLSVSNNPAGSFLSSTNEYGTFLWTNPAPLGVYTAKFYAANKWGANCRTVTVTVLDLPTVQFAATEYTAGEEVGTQLVQVVLSRQADATVQVAVAGTATTNWDFSLSSTSVVFSASGPTQMAVSVIVSNDNVSESTEYISLTLTNPASARIGAPDQFNLYVRDNDAISIMSANLVTGTDSKYHPPGCRIMQGLKPDIVGIQEWNITNVSIRNFVDVNFGTNFSYYIEPQSTNYFPLPNGIISRWPIKASGEWADPVVVNRDFAWATVDIPGERDLHVVSVHLYSSGTAADRETEARYITNYIRQANWPSNDYLVICGDMNTDVRTEPAIPVFTNIVSDEHKPADQNGDMDSNSTRTKPFDYVLPGFSLNSNNWTVIVGGRSFTNGIVFDSRLWTNPPAPILTNDSAAVNADHMAVMKAFSLGKTPPALQPIGSRNVLDHNTLQFDVQALPTDGDSFTLYASNLPPGAAFATVTNVSGTFTWTNASPIGSYTTLFFAADSDGIESESILIKVLVDGNVWINELHYDNASTDTNEGVEIAGAAGVDLSFYSLCAYNGGDGTLYMSNALTGFVDDEGCGFGAVWVPMDGLQNGPDGMALVRDGTNIIQFLSYEGSFVAVDGPAIEVTATDIGVAEAGTEAAGRSLQLGGSGTNYDAFAWAGPSNIASRGALNGRQAIYPCGSDTNQPPLLNTIGNHAVLVSNALTFGVTATDADGDPYILSASNLPAGATFPSVTNTAGTFTWTSAAPLGVYTSSFYAVDADGVDSETIVITVASGTEPPVIAAIANKYVILNRTVSFDVVATDAENDPITLSVSNAPAGSAFSSTNGNGSFLWTNAAPTGTYAMTFYAADTNGHDTEAVTIYVTPPTNLPVLQPLDSPWVLSGNTLAFGVNATDADGDTITLSVSNKPAGASFIASGGSGTFTWTNAAPVGTYTSTFYAADNDGTVSQSAVIHVLLNGALWINEIHYDNSGTDTNEGLEIAGTAGIDLSYYVLYAYNGSDGKTYISNGLAGTIDDEGCGIGAVWFPMSGLQNGPDGVALVLDGSNVVQFLSYGGTITASNGPASGLVSDNIKVYESASPTNVSVQLTGVGTSYVQFAWAMPTNAASTNRLNDRQWIYPCGGATNQPPFLHPLGNRSVGQSNTLSFTASAIDVDNDPITLSISNAPAGSSFVAGSGVFTWSNAAPIGVYTTTVFAADKDGTDQETILISVYSTATNPPVLQAIGNRSVVENNALQFSVTATEADGDPVTLSVSNAPGDSMLSSTNGNGTFRWTNAAPIGVYTASFYAVDKDGVDFEAITITVGAGTNLPVLQPIGNRSVTISNTLTFAITATDADNDAITLTCLGAPGDATFSSTNGNGSFRWTNAAPVGVYTTSFVAADNDGSDSETVTITVAAGAEIWINELHYDNTGTDSNEGVEVAGTAGIDLAAYSLLAYNGGDGRVYASNALSGTIDDEGCGVGAIWFAISGLQNGPSDAVALVRSGEVVQFLSYEGVMTASSGTAIGVTAVDLGVAEAGTETNRSLQLRGMGSVYAQFVWAGPTNLQSSGVLNGGQVIFPCPGDVDNDGMPNDWETQFFGGTTNAAAAADADSDGMDNLSEYIAGTVPTNDLSMFTADAVRTNAAPYIHFDSITNRVYNLYYRTNMASGGWDPWQTNIPGNGTTISITVTNAPDPAYFRPTVKLP